MLLVCTTAFVRGAGSDVADAVMKGDAAAVRKLVLAKADVNAPQVDGATALHWAVYRDNLELADLLLRSRADVNATNREGVTPLAMASLYGNAAMIERLLKAGADAKQRGPNGETMVMFAARNGSPQAIKVLVAAGADVNAKEGVRQTTALMWAAEQRHPAAVKALLEVGADYSAKSGPAGLPQKPHGRADQRRGRGGRRRATPCRGGRRAERSRSKSGSSRRPARLSAPVRGLAPASRLMTMATPPPRARGAGEVRPQGAVVRLVEALLAGARRRRGAELELAAVPRRRRMTQPIRRRMTSWPASWAAEAAA